MMPELWAWNPRSSHLVLACGRWGGSSLCPPQQNDSPPQRWPESNPCLHLVPSTHSKSGPGKKGVTELG